MLKPNEIIPYLDVTYLELDSHKKLESLLISIKESPLLPAGICVYPHDLYYVSKHLLGYPLNWVSVINFPKGNESITQVKSDILQALSWGATECDIVIPYQQYLIHHQENEIKDFIHECKETTTDKAKLKIILETGELSLDDIYRLSYIACEQGADFIKTSTGKTKTGATLEATSKILQAIKDYHEQTSKKVGLKISGGIATLEQANAHMMQVKALLGEEWLTPSLLRIGASKLFTVLIES